MKKITFLLVIGIMMTISASAQKPIQESVAVGKQLLPGHALVLKDLDVKATEAALASYLSKEGLKAGKADGFVFYGSQNTPKLGTLNVDIYTKVVQEGKKKDSRVKVLFVVTKGNMNPLTDADGEVNAKIELFLEEFYTYAYAFNVEQKINELNSDLAKEQKSLESAKKKKEKQQSKIDKMSKDISERQSKITTLQSDLEKTNTLLQQYKR